MIELSRVSCTCDVVAMIGHKPSVLLPGKTILCLLCHIAQEGHKITPRRAANCPLLAQRTLMRFGSGEGRMDYGGLGLGVRDVCGQGRAGRRGGVQRGGGVVIYLFQTPCSSN